MKALSFAVPALVACVSVTPPAPNAEAPTALAVDAALAQPARAEVVDASEPSHTELPMRPARIRAGLEPSRAHAKGTLLLWNDERTGSNLQELDVASGAVVREVPLGPGYAVDWSKSPSALYLLFAVEKKHRLVALDDSLAIRADVSADGETPTPAESALSARVTAGKSGVLVWFIEPCDAEGGCAVFETHRKTDLAVSHRRRLPYARLMHEKAPLAAPNDEGASDVVADEEPWSLDPATLELVSESGARASCPLRGDRLIDMVGVGGKVFVLTKGCCGGRPGGLFECQATP